MSEAGTQRKGKMRITSRRPLKPAGPTRKTKKRATRERKTYGPQDREDVGYRLMERWLEVRGIHLEDTRNQRNVGADGVDLDQDLYFELKAHARDPDDVERLESSEAQLAQRKKDRYWLVIAWGLEKDLKPELLFIQNPLAKLDTIPTGGTRVFGDPLGKGPGTAGAQEAPLTCRHLDGRNPRPQTHDRDRRPVMASLASG